jgi:mannose-1-phosphate guanylyltransferase
LKSGDFYWNAGMFVWKLSSILAAIEKNIPDTFKVFDKIYANLKKNSNPERAIGKQYEKLEKISIDFAVMEKAKNVYVVPATFDWDDVGSWRAIERHCCADINNIVEIGEVYSKDSKNCVVLDKSERATALVGVEDLIVIHAKDATLICKKDCSESLKDLVKTLPKNLK